MLLKVEAFFILPEIAVWALLPFRSRVFFEHVLHQDQPVPVMLTALGTEVTVWIVRVVHRLAASVIAIDANSGGGGKGEPVDIDVVPLQVTAFGTGVVTLKTLHFGSGRVVQLPSLAFLFVVSDEVYGFFWMDSGYVFVVKSMALPRRNLVGTVRTFDHLSGFAWVSATLMLPQITKDLKIKNQ